MPSLSRFAAAVAVAAVAFAAGAATPVPAPRTDIPAKPGLKTAVFAGGCFWGVEAVFRRVNGVTSAVSGYAGGTTPNPTYESIGTGTTGHAESVEVVFDPAKVSYGQLLHVFMSVVHDPTQLNRQGPDIGTQYRSAIFYLDDEQQRVARAYIAQLDGAKAFPKRIATEVAPLKKFYRAEDYHQDYVAKHPTQPYIVVHDLPKIAAFKQQFPKLYTDPR